MERIGGLKRRGILFGYLGACVAAAAMALFGALPAHAEWGGGDSARSYLTWYDYDFGGVVRKNRIKVYAFEGETICLGSNVYNSGYDIEGNDPNYHNKHEDEGSIDIVVRDIYGNPTPLDVQKDGQGYIKDVAMETAIINATTRGNYEGAEYKPLEYPVRETGVYTIEFHSYNGNKNGVTAPVGKRKRSEGWDEPQANGALIAAWDASVFDETGHRKTGRTYADFLALQMNGGAVQDTYYVLTTDSYIYKWKFNGAAPYTYTLFANNRGVLDRGTGHILYSSVKMQKNSVLPNDIANMGVDYVYPGSADTDLNKGFYLFFEPPAEELRGKLYQDAIRPDPATNVRFDDTVPVGEGTEPGAYEGMGGYFAFDVEEATTATLRLEFKIKVEKLLEGFKNEDGNYDADVFNTWYGAAMAAEPNLFTTPVTDPVTAEALKAYVTSYGSEDVNFAPVEISDVVTPYATNKFLWNGKDGRGVVIPAGKYTLTDIVYTVTTKAGEIHFPLIDMENASGGLTFERVSPICDKNGDPIEDAGDIYGQTKNVIYYDESSIFYGERAASSGASQGTVRITDANGSKTVADTKTIQDNATPLRLYHQFYQAKDGGTEGSESAKKYYKAHSDLKIGDHSHTSNVINYFNEDGTPVTVITDEQKEIIDFLDSAAHPVAKSTRSDGDGSTTDYAIANYWTFIPAPPAISDPSTSTPITIVRDKNKFNMTGRVFYDAADSSGHTDGRFDDMTDHADHFLDGVEITLYRQTADPEYDDSKTYVDENGAAVNKDNWFDFDIKNIFEKVNSGKTSLVGSYTFSGLTYDPDNGTDFLWCVTRPDPAYVLTSGRTGPDDKNFGHYALYAHDANGKGTEIQRIKVGGTGAKPESNKAEADHHTVTAIDVGYNYKPMPFQLTLAKQWEGVDENKAEAVAYELSYKLKDSIERYVYEYRPVSSIVSWKHSYNFLPAMATVDNKQVQDYFVSAEYYIKDSVAYRHRFEYDDEKGAYKSFVGGDEYCDLRGYDGRAPAGGYSFDNLPDLNGDGISSCADLGSIAEPGKGEGGLEWKPGKPAGTLPKDNDVSPYSAVLDREILTASTTITVTNATDPGTIEVLKFTGDVGDENFLQGATFRLYKGSRKDTEENVALYEQGLNQETTPEGFEAAKKWVKENLVGSATTRLNGRVAFAGLDVEKTTYTLREVMPPSGYRITQEYYEIHPKGSEKPEGSEDEWYAFGSNNYVLLNIANIPDTDALTIEKRLTGRAWLPKDEANGVAGDSFTFSVEFSAKENANIPSEEKLRWDKLPEGEKSLEHRLEDFAKVLAAKGSVQITEKDAFTEETVNNQKVPTVDTKATPGSLLEKSEEKSNAKMRGVEFPAAGTYVFTIREQAGADPTITYSSRVFTVKVDVVRYLKKAHAEDSELTFENSYLNASVSRIDFYDVKKTEGGLEETTPPSIFAGTSPLFTNTYQVADVELKTGYAIQKKFTGRSGDVWLDGTDDDVKDEFTFTVTGDGEDTQTALEKGNLVLDGLQDYQSPDNKWTFTVPIDGTVEDTKSPDGTKCKEIPFGEILFHEITFPEEYVNSEGAVVPNPTEEQIERDKLTVRTQPVHYTLNISENVPVDTNGIAYDPANYTLDITLLNAIEEGAKEADGIIDEIMYVLSRNGDEQGRCTILQEPINFDAYNKGIAGENEDEYGFVDIDGAEGASKDDIFFHKTEDHGVGLDPDEKYKAHIMTFNNTYSAGTTWGLKVDKVLKGREWVSGDRFRFTLTADSANPTGGCMLTPANLELTSEKKSDNFVISFTKAGDYKFTVRETAVEPSMEQQPAGGYTFTVHVDDDNKGHLSTTVTEGLVEGGFAEHGAKNGATATFTNTYKDEPATKGFTAAKQLLGRAWAEDESFDFILTPDEDTAEAIEKGAIELNLSPDVLTKDGDGYRFTIKKNNGTLSDDGTVTRDLANAFTFNSSVDDPKGITYTFTVTEVKEGFTDLEPVRDTGTLTFTVTRATQDHSNVPTGVLNVDVGYAEDDALHFVNQAYAAAAPTAAKTLRGTGTDPEGVNTGWSYDAGTTADGKEITAGSYEFKTRWTLTPTEGAKAEYAQYKNGDDYKSFPDGGEGVAFALGRTSMVPDFRFLHAGTYTFTVKEVPQTLTGAYSYIEYDGTEYTVTYTVTDEDGKLTAVQKVVPYDAVTFTNHVRGALKVSKTVQGTGPAPTDGFAFTVKFTNGTTVKEDGTGYVYAPDGENNVTFTLKDGDSKLFTGLPAGTQYTVTETPVDGFVTPEPKNGTVSAGATADETFVNYAVTTATASLTAQKTLTAGTISGRSLTFNFTLTPDDDNPAGDPVGAGGITRSVTMNASAASQDEVTDDFLAGLEYRRPGTYKYTLTEQNDGLDGVGYDTTPSHSVTVTVEPNAGSTPTALQATVTVDGTAATSAAFTNSYQATQAAWMPSITKDLAGRDWVEGDSFTFTLALKTGNAAAVGMPADPTVTVTDESAGYKETFGDVTFTQAGEYTFTLTEKGKGDAKLGEDTVTVTVEDDNGKLTVTKVNGLDAADVTGLTFHNTYKDIPAKLPFALQKTLKGRTWFTGESFTFTIKLNEAAVTAIKNGDLEVPGGWNKLADDTYQVTLTNSTGTPTVVYRGDITVNSGETNVYTFTVTEDNHPGVTCAKPSVTMQITVLREGVGGSLAGTPTAVASYMYANPGDIEVKDDAIPFVNQAYYTGSTNGVIQASKTITGRDWNKDGPETFTAEVEMTPDSDGVNVTDKDGVSFAAGNTKRTLKMSETSSEELPLTFLSTGTYKFTVTEQSPAGAAEAMLYDTHSYTVTFDVTADGDGWHITRTVEKDDGTKPDKIVFTNTAPGSLTVKKEVTGATDTVPAGELYTLRVEFTPPTGTGKLPDGWQPKLPDGADPVLGSPYAYTFTLASGKPVTFGNLPAGTIYKVTESDGKGNYVGNGYLNTPSNHTCAVTVTGSDPIPAGGTATVTVTNKVLAAVQPVLPVDKTLDFESTDGPWKEQTFQFKLAHTGTVPGDPVPAGGIPAEITVAAKDGWTNTLENLLDRYTYPLQGEYNYILSESQDLRPYVDFDGTRYNVTVKVYPDPDNDGALKADVSVTKAGDPTAVPAEKAAFTNHYLTGDLTVSKTVDGTAVTPSERDGTEFAFTVTLDDASISGTYGDMTFENGVAEFNLKHSESFTAEDLPCGIGYTVTEADCSSEGYVTTVTTGDGTGTGTVPDGTSAEVNFRNTKNASPDEGLSDLTVTKVVVGEDPEHDRKFWFTVTLGDASINGLRGEMNFVNGVARIALAAHDSLTATRLPGGVSYTVTEDDYSADGCTPTAINAEGNLMQNETAEVLFVNTFGSVAPPEPKVGTLRVTKTVDGVGADDDTTKFPFTVTLTLGGEPLSGHFGELDFVEGKANFTLANGEHMDITDLPERAEYTVEETGYMVEETVPDGYGLPSYPEGNNSHIEAGKTADVAYINHRIAAPPGPGTADLTVSKAVTGTDAETERNFNFTVTLDDTGIGGDYGGMTFTDGTATFTLHDGQSVTAEGLPAGVTYTVTETEADKEGYTTTVEGGTGTLTDGGAAFAAFVNHRDTTAAEPGNLVVTKRVEGDLGEQDREFKFTVTLSDTTVTGTYGDMQFTDGKASFTLKHDQNCTAFGLPGNAYYTVTEAEADTDGYTTTVTADGETQPGGTRQGAILPKDTVSVVFTNTKESRGTLTVSNTVTGIGDKEKEFHYTVTLNDRSINGVYGGMNFVNGVAEFTLKHGESIMAADLPTGRLPGGESLTCTVVETDTDIDDYTTTDSGGTDTDRTDRTVNGVIPANGLLAVAFVNHLEAPAQGALRVTKLVTGDGDPTKDFNFTVTLTDTTVNKTYGGMTFVNGVAKFTLKHGQSVTAEGLPANTGYTVTEEDYRSEDYTTTYSDNSTGIIEKDTTANVLINNDYAPAVPTPDPTGKLTVTKLVTGADVTSDDLAKPFAFTVHAADAADNPLEGRYGEMEFNSSGDAVFELHDGQSVTAEGLPAGTEYTVTEADYSADGFAAAWLGDSSGSIAADKTANVTCINEKQAAEPPADGTATLTVLKNVTGAGDTANEFNFTVTLSDSTVNGDRNGVNFTEGKATFTLKHGERKTFTFEGLASDATCTVTEDAVPADYDEPAFTAKQTGEGDPKTFDTETVTTRGFELPANSYTSVYVTNHMRDPKPVPTGSLTVSKTVTGTDAEMERKFAFTVKLDGMSGPAEYGGLHFNDGESEVFYLGNGESRTVTGLPDGAAYTVTEAEANADRYSTTATGASGTITAGSTARAVFLNHRDAEPRPTGSGILIVSKSVTGAAATDDDRTKRFTFTVHATDAAGNPLEGVYGEMEFINGDAVAFKLRDGQTKTATDLPDDTQFRVEESRDGAGGFTTTLSAPGVDAVVNGPLEVPVAKDAVVSVTCVNRRDDPPAGTLLISKTVTGNGERDRDFRFTVTLNDTEISGDYGDLTFTNGTASFTLRHGQSLAAADLPAGTEYTVTEASYGADGYTTTIPANASGVIPDGEILQLPFFNDRPAPTPVSETKSEPTPVPTPTPEPELEPTPTPAPAPGPVITVPQTSDDRVFYPWVILLVLSAAGLVTVGILYHRRNRR